MLWLIPLALVWSAAFLSITIFQFARKPAGEEYPVVMFEIAAGERFDQVAARLKTAGIITDALRFKFLAYFKKADKRFKAGEYRLTAAMTPLEVIDTLAGGKTFWRAFTIPEGYNLAQIAAELTQVGLIDSLRFYELATDPRTAASFNVQARTLEGYLFPDTYYFSKNEPAQAIIAKMVHRFFDKLPEQWQQQASAQGFSLHEVITLASIIEKETGAPAERPLIASVFYNRLKKNMRLESDPTVIYGVENFDGNLTRAHLTTPTPYNTYVIKGLPPGPIANPGRESIEAALNPAKSDFLYFVARKDHTHQFSTNLEDHNRAVREFQLRRKPAKTE